MAPSAPLRAVSLFSNCGAGDLGYAKAGFQFEVLAELERKRLAVASRNIPAADVVEGDLRETWPKVVDAYRGRAGDERPALCAACPPCQGMSTARSGRGAEADADAGTRDPRNLLVGVIASVVSHLKPRAIVVENVAAFLTRQVRHPTTGAAVSAARLLVDSLEDQYVPYAMVSDLADYGVPQQRVRSFLTLIDRREPAVEWLERRARAPFPRATHGSKKGGDAAHITLADALRDLAAGSLDASSADRAGTGLHSVPVWDARRYALVAGIAPHSAESAWTNSQCPRCGVIEATEHSTVCPTCEGPLARPVVQTETGDWRFVRGFRASSYRRMNPDAPAATVTTASGYIGSDNTLHPWENRVLSPLECQHLQTFPATFEWGETLESYGATNVRAMIGEAVPPRFTHLHGLTLGGLLRSGRPKRAAIAVSDDRVVRAERRLPLRRPDDARAHDSPGRRDG